MEQLHCFVCCAASPSDVQPEQAQAAAVTREAEGLATSRRERRADSERDNRIALVRAPKALLLRFSSNMEISTMHLSSLHVVAGSHMLA